MDLPDGPPRLAVPRSEVGWDRAATIPNLTLADGSGPALQETEVRLLWDDRALHVRFACRDRDIRGTYRLRDDPIWEEEVVELFLAPGPGDPARYFEFELSPYGVLFDAVVENPEARRGTMRTLAGWDCAGIGWGARADPALSRWEAWLDVPWEGLLGPGARRPEIWRANLHRIERPRDGESEFSCWSPTLTRPADFHRPSRFGVLELRRSVGRKDRGRGLQGGSRNDPARGRKERG